MSNTSIITFSGSPSRNIFEELIEALSLPTTEVVFFPQLPDLMIKHAENAEQLIRLRDAIKFTRAIAVSFPVADLETCAFLFGQENIDPRFIFTLDDKNLAYIPPRIFMQWWGRPPTV